MAYCPTRSAPMTSWRDMVHDHDVSSSQSEYQASVAECVHACVHRHSGFDVWGLHPPPTPFSPRLDSALDQLEPSPVVHLTPLCNLVFL